MQRTAVVVVVVVRVVAVAVAPFLCSVGSHHSHLVRAAENRLLLERQTFLELTDRRSFAMLPYKIISIARIHMRFSLGSAGTIAVPCRGRTFNFGLALLRFGGTQYIEFTDTLLVVVRAADGHCVL